jgi:hypothetical protein
MNTNTLLRPSAQLMASVRDELRDRRQARASRRILERELATYRSPKDVSDLLGSLTGQDDASVEEIREIIVRNQMRHALHRAS